jgi:hypothetical protein
MKYLSILEIISRTETAEGSERDRYRRVTGLRLDSTK